MVRAEPGLPRLVSGSRRFSESGWSCVLHRVPKVFARCHQIENSGVSDSAQTAFVTSLIIQNESAEYSCFR
jgi:hypothetical protein